MIDINPFYSGFVQCRFCCCWHIQAPVPLLTISFSLAGVVNAHAIFPDCTPQIMWLRLKCTSNSMGLHFSLEISLLPLRKGNFCCVTRKSITICPIRFFAANFVWSISMPRAVQLLFRSHGVGYRLSIRELPFKNYGWQCICIIPLHNAVSLCLHVWLCRRFAHAYLLTWFCFYHLLQCTRPWDMFACRIACQQ